MRGLLFFVVLAALSLGGCSERGERWLGDIVGQDQLACGSGLIEHNSCAAERQEAANDQQCRSWGAQPGTDGYLQCRMALNEQDQNRRQAALQAWQAGMRANQLPPVQTPKTTDTTCTGMGDQINCRSVTH